MSQNVIIYASVHHHNTEKVVKYIAPEIQADVINILKTPEPDISRYDHIILRQESILIRFINPCCPILKGLLLRAKRRQFCIPVECIIRNLQSLWKNY